MPKDPLDDLPKIHPRERLVTEAENELRRAYIEALSKLSTAECIQVINNVAHSEIALIIRQAIRMERHGDPDKPGGLV